MAFKIVSATSYLDALVQLKNFVTTPNEVSNAVPGVGNTGDGDVTNEAADDAAPTETWTLLATSSTNFTVTGSVSGAKADATVGVAYDNGIVSFTIVAGGTAFISGDYFTFTVTEIMGTQAWDVLDYNTDYDGNGNHRLYLKGYGNDGNEEIFVGIQTDHSDPTPYYCWILNGYTGYSASETFFTQMGARDGDSEFIPWMLLDDQAMKCWFVANGRRIMGCIRVGTIYAPFYLGRGLDYGFPTTYPYPLIIAGSSAYSGVLTERRWSTVGTTHRSVPNPYTAGYNGRASMMVLSGSWVSFGNYSSDTEAGVSEENCLWPGCCTDYVGSSEYANKFFYYGDPTPDGGHPVFPLILCQDAPDDNVIGELDGMYHVHGDGVVSEDEMTKDGVLYKIFQNTFHTSSHEYFALKLE